MAYIGLYLTNAITIGKLYSVHYFEYMNDFSFPGESHNFWEFICVDKGEVKIQREEEFFILKKGDICFHKPNEFHNVIGTGKVAPNLVVIAFQCDSPAMNFFRNRILKVDHTEHQLLAEIIIEARHCFDCRLDDCYLENMPKKESIQFGSEQMIHLNLEHFLIHLLRRYQLPLPSSENQVSRIKPNIALSKNDIEIFKRVHLYLEQNLDKQLTVEQICRDNIVGRSHLQKIFQIQVSSGIIQYFSQMKINTAKELIRMQHLNFTQISEQLGYTSIHYFSRQFKFLTGMSPSEYASSIRAIADGNFNQ